MLHLYKTSELTLRTFAARVGSRLYVKDYASSSDDEKQPKKHNKPAEQHDKVKAKERKEGEESAATRLNRLLGSMQTDTNSVLAKQAAMARPGEGHKKRKEAAKQEIAAKDILAAAERVASLLGEENKKQTESELLSKLLGHTSSKSETGAKEDEDAPKGQESDLSLSELIVGMKIDRRQQPQEQSRSEYVRRSLASKAYKQNHQQHKYQNQDSSRSPRSKEFKREAETYTGSVKLFESEPLGIFKNPEELRQVPDILSTWAHLQQRELKLQVSHPPSNYFEKMALWTEQGKVWRFPIDNEQDMNEEVDVDFSEHIFLEQHLEPWCPTKGPIRHFMELVCVGLSKNPYITARDKKEHILWYRDYFEAKKDILKDLMSKEKMNKMSASENKLES